VQDTHKLSANQYLSGEIGCFLLFSSELTLESRVQDIAYLITPKVNMPSDCCYLIVSSMSYVSSEDRVTSAR